MAALLHAVVLESAASGRAGLAWPEGDIASDTCTDRDVISHAITPPGTH
jgi:hypothetical protein